MASKTQMLIGGAVKKLASARVPLTLDTTERDPDKKYEAYADCIRVQVMRDNEPYLQEILSGRFDNRGKEHEMLAMSDEQREECRLHWNKDKKCLNFRDGKIAETLPWVSKGENGFLAFVQDKNGVLFAAHHTGISTPFAGTGKYLSHASFLEGKPAEMAGLIRINKSGKITGLIDSSGHYRPEALDMYRGIKALENEYGKEIFSSKSKIQIKGQRVTIEDFVKKMESPEQAGETELLHVKLRNERIAKLKLEDVTLSSPKQEDALRDALFQSLDTEKNKSSTGIQRVQKILSKTGITLHLDNPIDAVSPPLHMLARYPNGSLELAEALIKAGATVNRYSTEGYTPLHYTAYFGNVAIAQLLINQGGALDVPDPYDRTPLDLLLENANTMDPKVFHNMADIFLEAYKTRAADINSPQYQPEYQEDYHDAEKRLTAMKRQIGPISPPKKPAPLPPIDQVAVRGNIPLLKDLLDKGVDVHEKNKGGQSALDTVLAKAATMQPEVFNEVTDLLLEAYKTRMQKQPDPSPKHTECEKDYLEALKKVTAVQDAMLQAQFALTAPVAIRPTAPPLPTLPEMVVKGDIKAITNLLSVGVDVHAADKQGKTALDTFIDHAANFSPPERMAIANVLLDSYWKRAEQDPANLEYTKDFVDAVTNLLGKSISPPYKFIKAAEEKKPLLNAVQDIQQTLKNPIDDRATAAQSQAAATLATPIAGKA
jgi:ankyrin repeat protein